MSLLYKSINEIKKDVEKCRQCDLYLTRRQVVLGGDISQVAILLLGEAPGGKEDETGVPFAADAGKHLDRFLTMIDLCRDQIYIGNAVKCRPTVPSEKARYNGYKNRKPTTKEIRACSGWLEEEIKLLQPKIIVTLGGVPLRRLMNDYSIKVGDFRGQPFYHQQYQCQVFPLYHPASVIYDRRKEEVYTQDLKVLKSFLQDKGLLGKKTKATDRTG